VESQIEAAELRSSRPKTKHVDAQEIAAERERESIELSRTRVLQDLASARNPRYRDLLERSLRYLDDKLRDVNAASRPGSL
jgi:hypothetical protein